MAAPIPNSINKDYQEIFELNLFHDRHQGVIWTDSDASIFDSQTNINQNQFSVHLCTSLIVSK